MILQVTRSCKTTSADASVAADCMDALAAQLYKEQYGFSRTETARWICAPSFAMALKTYILPPNLTTQPGGAFTIGSIIADPLRPSKSISKPAEPLKIVTHSELESGLSYSSGTALSGSVWGQFLQVASVKIGGRTASELRSSFTIDCLETISLEEDPSDDYAAQRASEPRVRAAMNAGMLGRAPVYMISGIKVARGLRWESEKSKGNGADVGASAPINEEVSVGAEVSAEENSSYRFASRTEQDVVFAYQLHVIFDKGWRKRATTAELYVPKGGLLGKKDGKEADADVEALALTNGELTEVAENNEDAIETVKALESGEECACIVMLEG